MKAVFGITSIIPLLNRTITIAGLPSALIVKFSVSHGLLSFGTCQFIFSDAICTGMLAKKVSKAPKIAAVISLMICPSMVFFDI